MSDAPTQPASNSGNGYRFPRLFNDKLTLSPFTLSQIGWLQMGWDLQVRSLDLPDLNDDSLRLACGALGRALRLNPRLDPQAGVPRFLNAMQPDTWDTLYGLMRQLGPLAWTDVPGAQRDIVTGQPVSRGKIDSSGNFVPTSPDGVIAGFGLPSPALKLGKQYLSVTDPAIHLYLYGDYHAFGNDMKDLVTGGGIQFSGKTSGGTELKLRIGAGRDPSGGGAGFIKIQIGPDFAPMTPGQ